MQESQYRHRRVVCQELFSAEAPQVFVCLVCMLCRTKIGFSSSNIFCPGTPTRRNKWLSGEKEEEENRTQWRLTSRSPDDDISRMICKHFQNKKYIYSKHKVSKMCYHLIFVISLLPL